jgi:hypothetical protein
MRSIVLGLSIFCASLGALAADSIVTVTEMVDLNQAPAKSWAAVGLDRSQVSSVAAQVGRDWHGV